MKPWSGGVADCAAPPPHCIRLIPQTRHVRHVSTHMTRDMCLHLPYFHFNRSDLAGFGCLPPLTVFFDSVNISHVYVDSIPGFDAFVMFTVYLGSRVSHPEVSPQFFFFFCWESSRAPEQLWPNIANEKNTLIDKSTFAQIFILTHQRDSVMPLKMGSVRLERGDVGSPFLKGRDAPDGPGACEA